MFEQVPQQTMVEMVQQQIRSLILNGSLQAGTQLPPEKEFMKQLGVSRPTLRETLHRMVGDGLIEIRPGLGTFVKTPSTTTAIHADVVTHLLSSEDLHEIQEVREILEPEVTAMAAKNASENDLNELEKILKDMADTVRDGHSTFDLAWAFHLCVARKSGNSAMAKIVEIIHEMIKISQKPLYDQDFDGQKEVQDHKELLRVIKEGNPEKARVAMEIHLNDVTDKLDIALKPDRRLPKTPLSGPSG